MAVTTPSSTKIKRSFSISIDDETRAILDDIAEQGYDGNRAAAVRAFILIHAGDLAGALAQAMPRQTDPDYEPEHWEKRPLSFGLITEVARVVRAGSTADVAFDLAGVTRQQRGVWLGQGRKDQQAGKASLYADLVAALAKARAQAEAEDVERMRRLGRTSWQALLARMERQEPDRWAQRKRVDGHITHSALPAIDFERLDVGETRELVRLLRKASPDPSETRMGRGVRPVGELLPGDVLEGEAEEIPEASYIETQSAEAAPVEKPDH